MAENRAGEDPPVLLCDDLIDALERLLAEVFPPPGGPPPRRSTLLDEFPPDCQPGTAVVDTQTTDAANRLLAMFPAGLDVQNAVAIKVEPTTLLREETRGFTSRLVADPSFDYLVRIDVRAHRNRFNVIASLFHEFGHVADGLTHGFLPYEAAPALSSRDYIALTWQWELQAWRFMLQGVRAVVDADPEYAMCVAITTAEDEVLNALYADDVPGAMREIRYLYPEAVQRADWEQRRTGTISSQQFHAVTDYMAGILRPDPAAWGL